MLSQNDSLEIDFKEFTLGVDEKSIVGKAVLTAADQHPDLYKLAEPGQNPWGFHHDRSFDEKTGYRARSMLTVPMLSAQDEVIGVIQLINKKRDPAPHADARRTTSTSEVVPFDERIGGAGAARSRRRPASRSRTRSSTTRSSDLFEGFVDASVTAIESRDPTTSGHSRRVATLTVALAETVDAATDGPLSRRALHARRR